MEKLIEIEGKEIGFKCSAGTVRTYRMEYGRDIILDIASVEKEIAENKTLGAGSGQIAEEIAYTMAREYDPGLPEIGAFLDQFSPYFIYLVVPQITQMWFENMRTLIESKKNSAGRSGNGQAPSSS